MHKAPTISMKQYYANFAVAVNITHYVKFNHQFRVDSTSCKQASGAFRSH